MATWWDRKIAATSTSAMQLHPARAINAPPSALWPWLSNMDRILVGEIENATVSGFWMMTPTTCSPCSSALLASRNSSNDRSLLDRQPMSSMGAMTRRRPIFWSTSMASKTPRRTPPSFALSYALFPCQMQLMKSLDDAIWYL